MFVHFYYWDFEGLWQKHQVKFDREKYQLPNTTQMADQTCIQIIL